jgi:uncharacterized protein with FMN-binding domain
MHRGVLAIVVTVAGLVALLSFRTHSASPARTSEAAAKVPPLLSGERAVTGNTVGTIYGPLQVQVVLRASTIVGVNILRRPAETSMDIQIGQYAFPKLIGETLIAQSARIDTVSGATYTSGGYIRSLQSALDNRA